MNKDSVGRSDYQGDFLRKNKSVSTFPEPSSVDEKVIAGDNYTVSESKHSSYHSYSKQSYTFSEFGVDADPASLLKFAEPEFGTARVLATGDVNGDLKEEILVSHESRFGLYSPNGPLKFEEISIPSLPARPTSGAIVDINNDGLNDLVVTSFFDGTWINYNKGSSFSKSWELIPGTEGRIVGALSFFDVDNNGLLDIHLATSFISIYVIHRRSVSAAENILILNKEDGFEVVLSKKDQPGETLANLFTDTDNDGRIDLVQANDFGLHSNILNVVEGELKLADLSHVPRLLGSGMSVDSADINLDGNLETLITGSYHTPNFLPGDYMGDSSVLCNQWREPKLIDACERKMLFLENFSPRRRRTADEENCNIFKEGTRDKSLCKQIVYFWRQSHKKDMTKCEGIKHSFLNKMCQFQFENESPEFVDPLRSSPRKKMGVNALYSSDTSVWENELAEQYDIQKSCWSWGSKFGDLNHDMFEDLVMTNGFTGISGTPCDTLQFMNLSGKGFELGKPLNIKGTSVLALSDIDGDGDLDTVLGGPFIPYIVKFNNTNTPAYTFDFSFKGQIAPVIGAKVVFTLASGQKLVREIHLGDGYSSVQSPRQHVATQGEDIVKIRIALPYKDIIEIEEVFAPGHHYRVDID